MAGVIQIFTHRGTTTIPQLTLEGDGGTFGTGHGAGQLSGLLGKFDYSAATDYFSTNGQGPGDFFRDVTLSGNFGWKFSDTDSLRLTLRNNASDAGQPGQTLLPGGSTRRTNQRHSRFRCESGLEFLDRARIGSIRFSGFESRFQLVETSPPFGSFKTRLQPRWQPLCNPATFSKTEASRPGTKMRSKPGPSARPPQSGRLPRSPLSIRSAPDGNRRAVAWKRTDFSAPATVPRVGASYALRLGNAFWGATRLRASYGEGIKEPRNSAARLQPAVESRTEP